MSRSKNQKCKLLYLLRILMEKTDEAHPMTAAALMEQLRAYDISVERKSLYDDLEALRGFGIDVVHKSRTEGYYVGERHFQLPELKLLVDSVQSSRFITQKKTMELIRKIESLAGEHNARLLQRQVYVQNRVKSMNESVYYNVDEISGAITQDVRIRFRYFEYASSRERRFRRDGAFYEISPFALMWDHENYYMLGWDQEATLLKNYRVDKMTEISLTNTARSQAGKDAFARMDMSAYAKRVFGMFPGIERQVRLRFAEHLAGAVIDRFGKEVIAVPDGEGGFTVTVTVSVSPQFLAWLFGFGTEAEILSPEDVRGQMRDFAGGVWRMYAPPAPQPDKPKGGPIRLQEP